jgi:hypothetical protein
MKKQGFILLLLLLVMHTANAQISGCTDPMASNYNTSATINDGSCVYSNASVTPVTSYVLDNVLSETSGLIIWNNYLWTHNDNSDTNLYSLDTATAAIVQALPLSGVHNNDWEDIAQDSNYFYIGDFGNNGNGNRTDLKILRIAKTSVLIGSPIADTINFSYADQTDFTPAGANNTDFDCEAFIVTHDSIFLFTKQWVSEKTGVYALPKAPGTYSAQLKTGYDVSGLITGATYLESKRLVVLCGYSSLLQPFIYLLYDFSDYDFFSGNKRKISVSLPFYQTEGIATANGLKYYLSNEYFTQPPFVTNEQKVHILDLSQYIGIYLNYLLQSTSEIKSENAVRLYPNPANDFIIIEVSKSLLLSDFLITDSAGKTVMKGKLSEETSKIRLKKMRSGQYYIMVGETWKQSFLIIKE